VITVRYLTAVELSTIQPRKGGTHGRQDSNLQSEPSSDDLRRPLLFQLSYAHSIFRCST
jgi:hypothetical protein